MGKVNHAKEDEFLKGQIRSLKSENRNLKKRIRRLEKDLLLGSYLASNDEDEKETPLEEPDCTNCGKGILNQVIVVDRSFSICNSCGWRSRARKL